MLYATSNGSDGRWITKGLIWQQNGQIYFSKAFLKQAYPNLHPNWFNPTKRIYPYLNPRVNVGRARSVLILGGRGQGRKTRVFLQADVEKVILQRWDAMARKADPSGYGKWFDKNNFQLSRDVPERGLVKGTVLCSNAKLVAGAGATRLVTEPVVIPAPPPPTTVPPAGMSARCTPAQPPGAIAEADTHVPKARPPANAFIPTPFQNRVLEALRNRFRNADDLQKVLKCDRKRLYYDRGGHGLRELTTLGFVANDRSPGRGYYRPDSPPAEIATFLGENSQMETNYPTAGN